MEREPTWSAGDDLAGKYRLIEQLGRGGMGEVWSAEHLAIGGTVAIKLLSADVSLRPDTRGRFEREARAAAALGSPHVVRVFDHGTEGGVPFIVMELLVGETLAARLARGPMPPADVARVIRHVALALTCAHAAGIVHRDLKPENVFLVTDGGSTGEDVAKLLDFGIAKVTAEIAQKAAPTHTRSGSLLGTPLYMSPEQLRERPVDFRADLWALALVTFECLTGSTTFSGESVAEVIADVLSGHLPVPSARAPVPEGFDAWFARAASRAPADRFESARAMSDALAEVARREIAPRGAAERPEEPIGAPPAAVTSDGSVLISQDRPAPRTNRVWIGAAFALFAIATTGGWVASSAPPASTGSGRATLGSATSDAVATSPRAPVMTEPGAPEPGTTAAPRVGEAADGAPAPSISTRPGAAPSPSRGDVKPAAKPPPRATQAAQAPSTPAPGASTHVLGF